MEDTLLGFLTLFKILVVVMGISLTFWNLILGLLRRNSELKNRGYKAFFIAFVLIVALSILEFFMVK